MDWGYFGVLVDESVDWYELEFFNQMRSSLGRLSKDVFERRTSTGSGLFVPFGRDLEQILGQIVSIRAKTLSHTYLVASRHIKGEKSSLPVQVRRLKTSLLKLPIITADTVLSHVITPFDHVTNV